MNKETILQEAQRIVYGDRAATHGDFRENFSTAAKLFSAWTGIEITDYQAIQMLVCLKMARNKANKLNRDHYVDTAGYMELLSKISGE